MSTLPPLFHRLIDDAALFPPGNAAMASAVPAHAEHRRAWYAPLVGPFLCPASRLDELADQVTSPLGVGVIGDTGTGGIDAAVGAVHANPLLELRSIDLPLRGEPLGDAASRAVVALDVALAELDDQSEELPGYLELPRDGDWRPALEVIAEAGYRAKLRTGGLTPEAFPPESTVSGFIVACLDLGVPFKLTAGLHRAVRHTADDRVEQHGFLNVLLAVADALDGADAASIEGTLADRDAPGVADRVRLLPTDRAASVRSWVGSYGSCSIDEPLEDLLALGLITRE